jgi:hypothetical protein
VLYCDAESTKHDFNRIVESVSRTLGLAKPPPDFLFWSPHWVGEPLGKAASTELIELVTTVKPRPVFVDTLRTFFPQADQKPEIAVANVQQDARNVCIVARFKRSKRLRGTRASPPRSDT